MTFIRNYSFKLVVLVCCMCLKCELWSFKSLLLGSIAHTESVTYFTDCPAYQTVAICISN